LNHRDGPRTVDIFLERIADIAFSVWTIGYMYIVCSIQIVPDVLIATV
jgi:hypothetical protein